MWTYLKISDKLTRHSRVPRLIFKLIELWWIFWPCGGQNNKQTNLSGKYNKDDQITINKSNYKTLPSWKGERKVNQMVIYHYKFLKNNVSTNRMAKTCKGLKNVLRHFKVFFPLQACRVYILVPFFCTKANHKHIVQTSVVERIYELCLDWLLKLLKHETWNMTWDRCGLLLIADPPWCMVFVANANLKQTKICCIQLEKHGKR